MGLKTTPLAVDHPPSTPKYLDAIRDFSFEKFATVSGSSTKSQTTPSYATQWHRSNPSSATGTNSAGLSQWRTLLRPRKERSSRPIPRRGNLRHATADMPSDWSCPGTGTSSCRSTTVAPPTLWTAAPKFGARHWLDLVSWRPTSNATHLSKVRHWPSLGAWSRPDTLLKAATICSW